MALSKNVFQIASLILCIALSLYNFYRVISNEGHSWVSLNLFIYLLISLAAMSVNSLSFMIGERKRLPSIGFLVVMIGYLPFLIFPHKIVMF